MSLGRAKGKNFHVNIDYTNHRGERSIRRIIPRQLDFGVTNFHPDPQWLLAAFDIGKQAMRSFAMKDIHSWVPTNTPIEPMAPSDLPSGMSINDLLSDKTRGDLDG